MAIWWRMRYLSSVGFQQYVSQLLSVIEKGTLSHGAFNELALQLFDLQLDHNAAYRTLCKGREEVRSWSEIPAAPTVAFKELELTSIPPGERIKEFRSSGTTERKPSRHFHSAESLRVYEASLGPPLREHFFYHCGDVITCHRSLFSTLHVLERDQAFGLFIVTKDGDKRNADRRCVLKLFAELVSLRIQINTQTRGAKFLR